jgi:BlaI family transcriptional regulator, penicillinase repressor
MAKNKDIQFTRAEEEIMQILWKIERGVVKDIMEHFPEPKPAYNTVSTIIRILETKGYVDHKAYGKTHEYFPLISKDVYSKRVIKTFMKGYFNGSFKKMVSFFSSHEDIDVKELEQAMELMRKQIENRKTKK